METYKEPNPDPFFFFFPPARATRGSRLRRLLLVRFNLLASLSLNLGEERDCSQSIPNLAGLHFTLTLTTRSQSFTRFYLADNGMRNEENNLSYDWSR